MAPYPTELRVRVVAAVEEGGLSIPEAARIFQVGLTFIKKMLKLHRAGESLEPRHGGRPVPLLQEKETTLLRQELRARPDATLEELPQVLAAKCPATASLSTISRSLQALHLPRKKKSHREGTWVKSSGSCKIRQQTQHFSGVGTQVLGLSDSLAVRLAPASSASCESVAVQIH